MVSKITIFETHFDGAQFGPASVELPTGDDSDAGSSGSDRSSEPESADKRGSKSRFVMVLQGVTVFILLFGTLWVGLSRLLDREDDAE